MRRWIEHPALAGLLCLILVLLFHSPRLWLIATDTRGTFEWDRARSYLLQCDSPFREDVEPAMRWRFVPQVLVHLLGGNRTVALAFPWLGAVALVLFVTYKLRERGYDAETAFWLCAVLASSAPVLVSTGWLGVNDAWVALGLAYLATGKRRTAIVLACLVCPFIDERFVFGMPCALLARAFPFEGVRWWRPLVGMVLAALPYVLVRGAGMAFGRDAESGFLLRSVGTSTTYLWMAPLALWMAFRFAYVPAAFRVVGEAGQHRGACVVLLAGSFAPVLAGFLLASDTMRTAAILFPLCMWGVFGAQRIELRWARWLALGNLLVPAAHVTFTKVVPINSAFVELWRLIR